MILIDKERICPVWAHLQIWCDYCPAVFQLEPTDSFGVNDSDLIRDYRDHFEAKCPVCRLRTRFEKPQPVRATMDVTARLKRYEKKK